LLRSAPQALAAAGEHLVSSTTGTCGIDNTGELHSITDTGVITAIGAMGLNSPPGAGSKRS